MRKFAEDPNLLGLRLPRSLKGAIVGILSILLIGLLCWGLGLRSLAKGFLYPGYIILMLIEPLGMFLLSNLFGVLILFGVSSIPPAAIGALIFSDRIGLRISGVVLFAAYGIVWSYFSLVLYMMVD